MKKRNGEEKEIIGQPPDRLTFFSPYLKVVWRGLREVNVEYYFNERVD